MSTKSYSVSVVLLYTLCFYVSRGEILDGPRDIDDYAHINCQVEENIKNHLSLIISSLRNEIYDKNKIFEQKLNLLETIVKHGFEDTIDEKLFKFQKKIEEKMREISVSHKNDNIKQSLTSDVGDRTYTFNQKLIDLKMDINEIKTVGDENRQNLESLISIVTANIPKRIRDEKSQSIENKNINDVIPKLNMLLNMTADNTNSIKQLENKSNENLLVLSTLKYNPIHDAKKINELINATTAFMQQFNETKNRENEFREIRWSDCKREIVRNNLYYDYSRPLHPLADDTHRHVTIRTKNNGDTKFFLLHVGIQADKGAGVILSQEPEPKGRGYHFRILFWKNETVLGTVKDGDWNVLKSVHTTNNLSESRPFGVYIKIADDTVEVRREEDRLPLLLHKEARFTQVRYFGFSSHYNTGGNATILYDC